MRADDVAGRIAVVGIERYIAEQERKSLLRIVTCGSVDDGKSTLIGRLLYDANLVPEDQIAALETDSKRFGTQAGEFDFALLVDGLSAEREQGITIDVAYRYFTTARRMFIIADSPGHEQYTRNMVTAASNADLAVVLIDARKGILSQTRRHSFLVALTGIRQVVLAVNKMDLVAYNQAVFEEIETAYRTLTSELEIATVSCIPLSALRGDNLISRSPNTPWYRGPDLLTCLEEAPPKASEGSGPLRLPVQWVNRPDPNFRGFAGTVSSGTLRPGDPVRVLPSGVETTIARIVTADGDVGRAETGQAVTVVLADQVDVSRGDVLSDPLHPPIVSDQFEAHLVWMHEFEMLPGRSYRLKLGPRTVNATITRPKYRLSVTTFEHVATTTLQLNDIGVVNVSLDQPIAFEPYQDSREMGGFILIDRHTNNTVGAGMIHFGLRRADNLHWQHLEVDPSARAALKGHQPAVVWLTGLSGAGKSTIANVLERKLHARIVHTALLDGDNIRHGLNRDLGFAEVDRVENIRRVGEVCKLMAQSGLIVIAAFISPFQADRLMLRRLLQGYNYTEVHVDTPQAVAEARDTKGLYAKARNGQLSNFTGVDSPYELPTHPEVKIDTTTSSPDAAADCVINYLESNGVLPGV